MSENPCWELAVNRLIRQYPAVIHRAGPGPCTLFVQLTAICECEVSMYCTVQNEGEINDLIFT
jgi:hypothetical protein